MAIPLGILTDFAQHAEIKSNLVFDVETCGDTVVLKRSNLRISALLSFVLIVLVILSGSASAYNLTIQCPNLTVVCDGEMHPNTSEIAYLISNIIVDGLQQDDVITSAKYATYQTSGIYLLNVSDFVIKHYSLDMTGVVAVNVTDQYSIDLKPGNLIILSEYSENNVTNITLVDDTAIILSGLERGGFSLDDTFISRIFESRFFKMSADDLRLLLISVGLIIAGLIVLIFFVRKKLIVKNAKDGVVVLAHGKDAIASGPIDVITDETSIATEDASCDTPDVTDKIK